MYQQTWDPSCRIRDRTQSSCTNRREIQSSCRIRYVTHPSCSNRRRIHSSCSNRRRTQSSCNNRRRGLAVMQATDIEHSRHAATDVGPIRYAAKEIRHSRHAVTDVGPSRHARTDVGTQPYSPRPILPRSLYLHHFEKMIWFDFLKWFFPQNNRDRAQFFFWNNWVQMRWGLHILWAQWFLLHFPI